MLGKRLICDDLIGSHEMLSQVKNLYKPWLSERDAVPHAPFFLPQFGDAPHLVGALKKSQKRVSNCAFSNII